MDKIYDFDVLADRTKDYSKKWCCKQAVERYGKIPKNYISMWIADMDFKIAEPIQKKFQGLIDQQTFGYIYCYDDFFDAVIKWNERKAKIHIRKDSVSLNYGVVSTLYNIVQTFCPEPTDTVLIHSPVYGPFRDAAVKNNRCVVENELYVNENNRYMIDFEKLEKQIVEEQPKVYIFCSPHNPSGRIWTESEVEKVAKLCLDHGVVLVADEVHSDHIYKGPFFSTLSLPEKYRQNLIFLNSANKGFNFAGLKTSYSIVPSKKLKQKLDTRLEMNCIDEPNIFGIAGIVASYTPEGENWLKQCYTYITENYEIAKTFIIENCPELQMMDMESSYLLWIDVSNTGMDGDTFVFDLAREKGILFQEGSSFGKASENFVRINIGTSKAIVMEALKSMHEWLVEKKTRSEVK